MTATLRHRLQAAFLAALALLVMLESTTEYYGCSRDVSPVERAR